jgi:isopenicillin N synthase-like dioxygenase
MADPYSTDNHSTLVVNHYPSVAAAPHQAGTARITAHTDEPLITLLFTSPGVLSYLFMFSLQASPPHLE